MILSELVTRFRSLVSYDLDPFDGQDSTDAQVVTLLEEASRELAELCYLHDPAVSLSLTAGTHTYSLDSASKRIIEPYSVVIDASRLANAAGSGYGMWTYNELERRFPTWMSDDQNTPTKAVFLGESIVFHPTPNDSFTAYIDAKIAPAELSADDLTATPELPSRLHPYLAEYAVYRACKHSAQESAQFVRLKEMYEGAISLATRIGEQNMRARVGTPSTSNARSADYLYL